MPNGKLRVPIEQVRPGMYSPRLKRSGERIVDLAKSFQADGQARAIVVRPFEGKYEVVIGESALEAMRHAGVNEVDVVVEDISQEHAFRRAYVEQVSIENLPVMHNTLAIWRLMMIEFKQNELGLTRILKAIRQDIRAKEILIAQAGMRNKQSESEPIKTRKTNSDYKEIAALYAPQIEKFLNSLPRPIKLRYWLYLFQLLELPHELQEVLKDGLITAKTAFRMERLAESEFLLIVTNLRNQCWSHKQVKQYLDGLDTKQANGKSLNQHIGTVKKFLAGLEPTRRASFLNELENLTRKYRFETNQSTHDFNAELPSSAA